MLGRRLSAHDSQTRAACGQAGKGRRSGRRDLFFVSMSVDPKNDTPERLKAFADAFDIGPGWLS
jgi:cytochrome oxidase Cu insertion factor (SCO1/SenC/PrrC family)